MLFADDDELGRVSFVFFGDFCCTSAMKPGILSLAEGEGWTYTCAY